MRRSAGVVLGVALLALAVAACAPATADQPPYHLTDKGNVSVVEVIDNAAEPSGYVGAGVIVYNRYLENKSLAQLVARDLATGEETDWITGTDPSLCVDGLYFSSAGRIKYITEPGGEIQTVQVTGYKQVLASPQNQWLLLYNEGDQNTDAKLAINNRETAVTTPLAWSSERDGRRPSWDGNDDLLLDARAPDGTDADRAIYKLMAADGESVQGALIKLSAFGPAGNGAGLVACLENSASSTPAVAIYDVESRERIGLVEPEEQGTFGDIVWVAEDTIAVEELKRDEGPSIILLQVER